MGKKSIPEPPDYKGAALEEAKYSRENLVTQNYANRPSIYTPWGAQTWDARASTDPATGQAVTEWSQNVSLDPSLQNALNAQIAIQQGRSDLASGFMQRVGDEYRLPFDWKSLPPTTMVGQPQPMMSSVADYSPGLRTDIPTNNDAIVRGFSFGGPRMGIDSATGGLSYGTPETPVSMNFDPMLGGLTRGVQSANIRGDVDPMMGLLATRTNPIGAQSALNLGDNPLIPQFDSGYRDRIATSLMERMNPLHEYQRRQLETQLSNQGFQTGTEGYRRALDEMNQRQAAERYNALDIAGAEAQRLYDMQSQSAQQAFQQDLALGQFANQAMQQQFGQDLSANQFQNQAAQQAFSQNLDAIQAANAAEAQRFNQAVAAGQFGNEATQQAYAQSLGAGQAINQAAQQLFEQGLQGNQFRNEALRQAYEQTLGAGTFGNTAQQQLYAQLMGQAELANQANQLAFAQNTEAARMRNAALGQASALDLARMQAVNNARQQDFQQALQYSDQMNKIRQQAIVEQMQSRGMSLNEMNALLTGQQVGMPQFPSFHTAGIAQTPQLLQAADMQHQAALDAYNAKAGAMGNVIGGLTNIAGAINPFSFGPKST